MIDKLKSMLQAELALKLKDFYKKDITVVVEEPKRAGQGDISVPVFSIVKQLDFSMKEVAGIVAEYIRTSSIAEYLEEVSVVGGFINITLDKVFLAEKLLEDFKLKQEAYGSSETGHGKVVVIDYSSPNIAKPFSIGHLRSTIIGHALGNLLEKCGYKVVRINHLGDFGTQFGKIIYAYLHFGDEAKVRANPIQELVKLYVEFHELAKTNPEIEDEARSIFKELENNNPEYVRLWQYFRDESLKDYMQVYDQLGVKFDSYDGEAFYNDKMQPVIAELERKHLLKEDQGAMIVDLGDDLPPALIQKSDGSTLYITRDLAALFYRKDTYGFNKVLYVVGNEQKLHFEQLKAVIKKMGYPFADDIVHVNFGLVLQDGKKMSTRKGKIVRLVDVLNEATDLSLDYIETKNPDLENKTEIARKIGVSAIIFNDLKNHRSGDFEFNLEEMVNFFGQTGPYLQYTSVRINSILSEDSFTFDCDVDRSWFDSDHVFQIVKTLSSYRTVVLKSVEEYAPSVLAKYLLNLASQFNSFYTKEKVLVDDYRLRHTKMHLLWMVRTILNDGMRLLGMQVIEKM